MPSAPLTVTSEPVPEIVYESRAAAYTTVSLPAPPVSRLFAELPIKVSSPDPPMTFSMTAPRAMVTLPTRPPTSENVSGLRLIRCAVANPE